MENLEQRLRLLGGQVGGILALDRGALDHGGGVALDEPVPDRNVEGRTEHGVDGPDGRCGEAGAALGQDEGLDIRRPKPIEGPPVFLRFFCSTP